MPFASRLRPEQCSPTERRRQHEALFVASNTIVIASSVSNAAPRRSPRPTGYRGLIDGVAVAEPVLELMPDPALTVTRGTPARALRLLHVREPLPALRGAVDTCCRLSGCGAARRSAVDQPLCVAEG
jgi:hypothetical protein